MKPLLLLPLIFLASACSPEPKQAPDGGDFASFLLKDGEARAFSLTLEADEPVEALLTLTASLSGAEWKTLNGESVVVSVVIDGKRLRHAVWTRTPEEAQVIRVGRLAPGTHEVKLTRSAELTRAHAAILAIGNATLTSDPDQELARFAPIILGRDDSAFTDLPAFLFARKLANGTLEYSVAFTNEDGGTGLNPKLEVARWGRLTDLEWAMDVERDAAGNVTARRYQDGLHLTLDYTGPLEDGHALLRVATTNGVFSDDGQPSPFKLAPPVFLFDDAAEPRERVMDQHPWFHALSEEEGLREEKIDWACKDAAKVWMLNCYLYVDVTADASAALTDRRVWGLEARAESGAAFKSEVDLGADARLDRTGNVRVAIPFPPSEKLQSVHVYFADDGKGPVDVTLTHARLRKWGRQRHRGTSASVHAGHGERLLAGRRALSVRPRATARTPGCTGTAGRAGPPACSPPPSSRTSPAPAPACVRPAVPSPRPS